MTLVVEEESSAVSVPVPPSLPVLGEVAGVVGTVTPTCDTRRRIPWFGYVERVDDLTMFDESRHVADTTES